MDKKKNNRREFLKMTTISGIGLGLSGHLAPLLAKGSATGLQAGPSLLLDSQSDAPFIPHRVASWWVTLDDILWPQKSIIDKIKQRAEGFAKAEIDTAINFGFHIRFDFSNYFDKLHGYYANVCDELHKYNIKFLDHYSCNDVERPRGEEEVKKLNRNQRHHVLLYPDPIAAKIAQYEGHLFQNICEVDLRDGGRGYAPQYQFETFCHNNPGFLDMHKKYLQRLLREVPVDGFQIDDMCSYSGLTACGCKYCRERFRRDYGHEIPPFGEKSFWGNTDNKNMLLWGNYDNPAFRDWLRMKSESIVDHVKMIKEIIKDKPLMTCCSSAGPIILNAVSLNLEAMAPELDWFMLENVGINVRSVDWIHMDPEALIQKDVAEKRGNAPAMALSYTIYEEGGYLGWSVARYWGVANWSSTLNGRLVEDPPDAMEIEDIIRPYNNWELKNSKLDLGKSKDFAEARLVSSRDCRENGWRDERGREQWDAVKGWSSSFVKNNVGYRILRREELVDEQTLCSENTPLILDNVGCISDLQWTTIKKHINGHKPTWVALPFGVCDEKGMKRKVPFSKELLKMRNKNLVILPSATKGEPSLASMQKNKFQNALRQISGDKRWAARVRFYDNKPVIHFLNTALIAVPHPTLKDMSGTPVLKGIRSDSKDNQLVYELDTRKVPLSKLLLASPEWGGEQRNVTIDKISDHISRLHINLNGIRIYAVAQ